MAASWLRRTASDDGPNERALLEQHADLAPDLAEELAKLRRIHAALRAAADESVPQDTTASSEEVEWPERIGRYRIERLLGAGGFGRVFLAWDEELGRRVAIKTPHRARLTGTEAVATYLAEARLLAKLDHPSIVPVYDVGRTTDGGCYVVSKWIPGTDLANRLRESPLDWEEALRLVTEMATALRHAHSQGIVHRDIKPANILLDRNGQAWLADFGLAVQDDAPTVAPWGGTPRYMSPEQARGEGHRIDGRSDLFSLGVVLYEAVTGVRPFSGENSSEVLEQIVSVEPPSMRTHLPDLPEELDRIVAKLLAKRAADRYPKASDLLADLLHVGRSSRRGGGTPIGNASSTVERSVARRVIPKGLRSFAAEDAEFFLELLPGPRDRDGVPEVVRLWKRRIEQEDSDETFAVGLLYGPSGCGKSSLLRAGILPRLASHVDHLIVEATPDETESQLLKRLRQRFPTLPIDEGLARCLAALRRGAGLASGHKLLIVIDQFEQWLSGRSESQRRELVEALRQCDGGQVQCLLLVRDDFWLAVSRFMAELELELSPARNTGLIDLFDPLHARQVLIQFGRAYGRLPEAPSELEGPQREFVTQAIAGLVEDDKIIPVRLALFAEMMKGRPWVPDTLRRVGGPRGLGVTFLDETFCARTANPRHRDHERGARRVLESLLPSHGSPIKGHVRSYPELMDLAGYGHQPREFKELMRILDGDTRLLTPADLLRDEPARDATLPSIRYYQLTHDYLVPSLREWLTRNQKATVAGRAELRLAERSALWSATGEQRQLPSWSEWLHVRCWTRSANWTESQRRMMRAAARRHRVLGAAWLACGLLLVLAGAELGVVAQQWLLHLRAATAPAWLLVGREEAIFPVLAEERDPTLRTRLIHGLSALLITPDRLVDRAAEPLPTQVRQGLLLAAGEMLGEPESGDRISADTHRRASEDLVRQLLQLHENDPHPGIHGAAEWVLRRCGPEAAARTRHKASDSPMSAAEKRWYVDREGHSLLVVTGPTRFQMGAASSEPHTPTELPAREAPIWRSFSIASQETTVAQWSRFLASGPAIDVRYSWPQGSSNDSPQIGVTWYAAAAYCNWLSERAGIPTSQWCFVPNAAGHYGEGMKIAANWIQLAGYRLPSEAEWEYACRAGAATPWYFGNETRYLAAYVPGPMEPDDLRPAVGQRKPNAWGLFDMSGGASEWCLDTLSTATSGSPADFGAQAEELVTATSPRVLRGGSYTAEPAELRSAARQSALPDQPRHAAGFRVVRGYP